MTASGFRFKAVSQLWVYLQKLPYAHTSFQSLRHGFGCLLGFQIAVKHNRLFQEFQHLKLGIPWSNPSPASPMSGTYNSILQFQPRVSSFLQISWFLSSDFTSLFLPPGQSKRDLKIEDIHSLTRESENILLTVVLVTPCWWLECWKPKAKKAPNSIHRFFTPLCTDS